MQMILLLRMKKKSKKKLNTISASVNDYKNNFVADDKKY